MVDDGDGHSKRSSAGRVSPLPPIPTLSDLIANSQPEPGPSNSHSQLDLPNVNSLHISSPPSSSTSSGNASELTSISPGHEQKPTKRPNPLTDLIDTEKSYVDLLGGVIRKVASAWSKNNLPPKELDAVFRAVEGIYKSNRALFNKLKEIGPSPSSPKALGDLLMRWIGDLDAPYSRYAQVYLSAFDNWEPIKSNKKLPTLLSDFSALHPPQLTDVNSAEALWTLDGLLALPRIRLKYYKRLYGRLLKSTSSGRSDYQLLLVANEKLDSLMGQLETRSNMLAGIDYALPQPSSVPTPESEIRRDLNTSELIHNGSPDSPSSGPSSPPKSRATTLVTLSGEAELSSLVMPSNLSLPSASRPPSIPSISDVESMIDTRMTLDIFSMKPKPVKLSLNPPGLPFMRQLRCFYDVRIRFISRTDGIERIHEKGRVFLMTDLFLICELPDDVGVPEANTQKRLSLCYPPLAARHLSATAVEDTRIDVVVLKKEVLEIYLATESSRDNLLQEFDNAIQTALTRKFPTVSKAGEFARQSGLVGPSLKSKMSLPAMGGDAMSSQSGLEKQSTPSRPSTADTLNSIHFNGQHPGLPLQPSIPPNGQAIPGRNLMSPPPSAPQFRGGPGYIAQPKPMPLPPDIPNMLDRNTPQPHHPIPLSFGQTFTYGTSQMGQQLNHQYSAPPSEELRPPPRGASLAQTDAFVPGPYRRGPSLLPPAERAFESGKVHSGFQNGSVTRDPSRSSAHSFGEHSQQQNRLKKASSSRSLNSQYSQYHEPSTIPIPPVPPREPSFVSQNSHTSNLANLTAPILPSVALRSSQAFSGRSFSIDQYSPPPSPTRDANAIPTTSTVSASMKCKVFLKQQHAQWKSLGAARLKLYHQHPTHIKQLVVEADSKDHPVIISTIILTDGVERVGKTGVAIELSDKGQRTGIVYMIQLRNESSAGGLFDQLLLGSDRSTMRP